MKVNVFKMSTRNGSSKLLAESKAYRAKISIYIALDLFMGMICSASLQKTHKNIFKIYPFLYYF